MVTYAQNDRKESFSFIGPNQSEVSNSVTPFEDEKKILAQFSLPLAHCLHKIEANSDKAHENKSAHIIADPHCLNPADNKNSNIHE